MRLRENLDSVLFSVEGMCKLAFKRLETGIVFNPLRKELRVDPHPFYRRLRERDPFHRSRPADGWVLTRYADIHAVLADKNFSSDERNQRRYPRFRARHARAGLPDPYGAERASMSRLDPPDHTRLRTLGDGTLDDQKRRGGHRRVEEVPGPDRRGAPTPAPGRPDFGPCRRRGGRRSPLKGGAPDHLRAAAGRRQ